MENGWLYHTNYLRLDSSWSPLITNTVYYTDTFELIIADKTFLKLLHYHEINEITINYPNGSFNCHLTFVH